MPAIKIVVEANGKVDDVETRQNKGHGFGWWVLTNQNRRDHKIGKWKRLLQTSTESIFEEYSSRSIPPNSPLQHSISL
jgi:hypothetical protein